MLDQTAAVTMPFRSRLPWIGADLQTLRNRLRGPVRRPVTRGSDHVFKMSDGTGDVLVAVFNPPSLERTPPRDGPMPSDEPLPLVLLVHGLTGCAESDYMLATAAFLGEAGFPCLRLNLRGAGPTIGSSRERYHAGRSEDLREVLAQAPRHVALAPWTTQGMIAVGFSLGGNMLMKLAAEDGNGCVLRGVVAVSSPLDLHAASMAIRRPRNVLYHRYLLRRMKREALEGRSHLTVMEREAILGSRDVYDFDDRFIAPRNGFDGADSYYRRCAAGAMLGDVAVPAMIIHSVDDPWVPADSVAASIQGAHAGVRFHLTSGGGHVGFHGTIRGTDHRGAAAKDVPWSDQCILGFCEELTR